VQHQALKDLYSNEDDPQVQEEDFLEATDHLLDALMEHLDDCGTIIKCLSPDPNSKEHSRNQRKFKQAIKPYKNHIGKIVNHIKHNQGRLRPVKVSWPGNAVIGYFVEGPFGDNGVGPESSIHKDDHRGFSVNRDFPFHLCQVHSVSRNLVQTLRGMSPELRAVKPLATLEKQARWIDCLTEASGLDNYYFPWELNEPKPLINITSQAVRIEYPSKRTRIPKLPPQVRYSMAYAGDNFTRSYRF